MRVEYSQGTGGIYELAEQWTDEFENLHLDQEWDGEFFDEIEKFCNSKNTVITKTALDSFIESSDMPQE
jgi:hypothetical protein